MPCRMQSLDTRHAIRDTAGLGEQNNIARLRWRLEESLPEYVGLIAYEAQIHLRIYRQKLCTY